MARVLHHALNRRVSTAFKSWLACSHRRSSRHLESQVESLTRMSRCYQSSLTSLTSMAQDQLMVRTLLRLKQSLKASAFKVTNVVVLGYGTVRLGQVGMRVTAPD